MQFKYIILLLILIVSVSKFFFIIFSSHHYTHHCRYAYINPEEGNVRAPGGYPWTCTKIGNISNELTCLHSKATQKES